MQSNICVGEMGKLLPGRFVHDIQLAYFEAWIS